MEIVSTIFAAGALIGLVGGAGLLFVLLFRKNLPSWLSYQDIKKNGRVLSLIIAVFSVMAPLIYSSLFTFEPCTLCWWQRVFMFPIAIILLVALVNKDRGYYRYTIPMAVAGLCIGIYQYMLQMNVSGLSSVCGINTAESCSAIYVMEFGFVTIPLMSAISFFILLVLFLIEKKK